MGQSVPTWLVHLWLSNDEGSYEYARGIANAPGGRYRAVEDMREAVESIVLGDEPPASLATDLLTQTLGEVDWREVAAAFRDEDDADPIAVDCAECRMWSPLPTCEDDECGCSECERVRADRAYGPCPNCGIGGSALPCPSCAAFGAHGGECQHGAAVPA